MTNNNNNNKSGKTARLTTFGYELGYINSHEPVNNSVSWSNLMDKYKYENLPDWEIARRQKVAKKLDWYNIARHLSPAQLFKFLKSLTDLSKSVRDENIRWINNYHGILDSVYNLMVSTKYPNGPKGTYDNVKINTKKLKSVIRVLRLEDAWRIVEEKPYIHKSLLLIGDAYNKYETLGSYVKDYSISKKSMDISLYDINKSVVLPEIVDPLLESIYKEFYYQVSKGLYESTDILTDDWYEDCS